MLSFRFRLSASVEHAHVDVYWICAGLCIRVRHKTNFYMSGSQSGSVKDQANSSGLQSGKPFLSRVQVASPASRANANVENFAPSRVTILVLADVILPEQFCETSCWWTVVEQNVF